MLVIGQRRLVMTDDIVTRLRERADAETAEGFFVDHLSREAADEIQRLQDACDYYHKMCSMIADKNFTANEEIERLRGEIERLREEVTSWREQAMFEHTAHCWCNGLVESHVEKSREGRDY